MANDFAVWPPTLIDFGAQAAPPRAGVVCHRARGQNFDVTLLHADPGPGAFELESADELMLIVLHGAVTVTGPTGAAPSVRCGTGRRRCISPARRRLRVRTPPPAVPCARSTGFSAGAAEPQKLPTDQADSFTSMPQVLSQLCKSRCTVDRSDAEKPLAAPSILASKARLLLWRSSSR